MENKNPFLEMKKAASERVRLIYESQDAGETVARNFRKAGQDCFRTVKTISRHFEQVTGAWHEIAKNSNRLILTIRLWTLRIHVCVPLVPGSRCLECEIHGPRISGQSSVDTNLAFQAS